MARAVERGCHPKRRRGEWEVMGIDAGPGHLRSCVRKRCPRRCPLSFPDGRRGQHTAWWFYRGVPQGRNGGLQLFLGDSFLCRARRSVLRAPVRVAQPGQRFCAAVSSPAGLSRGLSALRFLSGAQSRQENKASPKGGRVCQA